MVELTLDLELHQPRRMMSKRIHIDDIYDVREPLSAQHEVEKKEEEYGCKDMIDYMKHTNYGGARTAYKNIFEPV